MVSRVLNLHEGGTMVQQQPSRVKNVLVIIVSVAVIALIGRSTKGMYRGQAVYFCDLPLVDLVTD